MDTKIGLLPVLYILILTTVLQSTNAQLGHPGRRRNMRSHPEPLTRPGANRGPPNPQPYRPPPPGNPAPPVHPAPLVNPAPPPVHPAPPAYNPQPAWYPPYAGGFPGQMAGMKGGNKPNCTMMCMMRLEYREVNPRCGYDGKDYRNECMLKCKGTWEACDGTCPCYGSLNSPPSYLMIQPAPGVFPAGMFPGSGAKKPRPGKRQRGRRPNCFCKMTSEMVCTTEGKSVAGECEAYCTYKQVKCDRPCPCLGFGGMFGGMRGGRPGQAGYPGAG